MLQWFLNFYRIEGVFLLSAQCICLTGLIGSNLNLNVILNITVSVNACLVTLLPAERC
jgi:hypothetical protein